jgi:hypothetical protein
MNFAFGVPSVILIGSAILLIYILYTFIKVLRKKK